MATTPSITIQIIATVTSKDIVLTSKFLVSILLSCDLLFSLSSSLYDGRRGTFSERFSRLSFSLKLDRGVCVGVELLDRDPADALRAVTSGLTDRNGPIKPSPAGGTWITELERRRWS